MDKMKSNLHQLVKSACLVCPLTQNETKTRYITYLYFTKLTDMLFKIFKQKILSIHFAYHRMHNAISHCDSTLKCMCCLCDKTMPIIVYVIL